MSSLPLSHTGVHVRHHGSVLAGAEKRLLIAIARRLPPWIGSDHLSALGLLAMVVVGLSLAFIRHTPWAALVAIAALALNWFGDSLDGTVARVREQQRPRYGFYLDHVIDLVGAACLLVGLACSGLMHPTIALALLAVYSMVCAESYLATHTLGVFRLSFAGIGPTELRIILAVGIVKTLSAPIVQIAGVGQYRLFDIGGAIAIAGLTTAFLTVAARNVGTLFRAEPLPTRQSADL
jgi:phosphatidylglycerophosphate synthase